MDFQKLAREAEADFLARRFAVRRALRSMAVLFDEPADFALIAMMEATLAVEAMGQKTKKKTK